MNNLAPVYYRHKKIKFEDKFIYLGKIEVPDWPNRRYYTVRFTPKIETSTYLNHINNELALSTIIETISLSTIYFRIPEIKEEALLETPTLDIIYSKMYLIGDKNKVIYTPWSNEHTYLLNKRQYKSSCSHILCKNRNDSLHFQYWNNRNYYYSYYSEQKFNENNSSDRFGLMLATEKGWICPVCNTWGEDYFYESLLDDVTEETPLIWK